jgi:hypothetical protein
MTRPLKSFNPDYSSIYDSQSREFAYFPLRRFVSEVSRNRSFATFACRRPITMSPLCQLAMTLLGKAACAPGRSRRKSEDYRFGTSPRATREGQETSRWHPRHPAVLPAHTGGARPEDGRAAPGRANGREAPPRAAYDLPGPDLPNPPSSLSMR